MKGTSTRAGAGGWHIHPPGIREPPAGPLPAAHHRHHPALKHAALAPGAVQRHIDRIAPCRRSHPPPQPLARSPAPARSPAQPAPGPLSPARSPAPAAAQARQSLRAGPVIRPADSEVAGPTAQPLCPQTSLWPCLPQRGAPQAIRFHDLGDLWGSWHPEVSKIMKSRPSAGVWWREPVSSAELVLRLGLLLPDGWPVPGRDRASHPGRAGHSPGQAGHPPGRGGRCAGVVPARNGARREISQTRFSGN
jgi:hypothetical protein